MLRAALLLTVLFGCISLALAASGDTGPSMAPLGDIFAPPEENLMCAATPAKVEELALAKKPSGDIGIVCHLNYPWCPDQSNCGEFMGCGAVVAPCQWGSSTGVTTCCLEDDTVFSCSSGTATPLICPCDNCSEHQVVMGCH